MSWQLPPLLVEPLVPDVPDVPELPGGLPDELDGAPQRKELQGRTQQSSSTVHEAPGPTHTGT